MLWNKAVNDVISIYVVICWFWSHTGLSQSSPDPVQAAFSANE